MGCPIAVDAGSTESWARMSVMIASLSRFDRLRSISISVECTPSACSSNSARPVRRPTCTTSGTWAISFSANVPILLASASDVPGLKRSDKTSDPSLNAGKNARGKNGMHAAEISTATAAIEISIFARGNDQLRIFSSHRLRYRTSRPSPLWIRGIFGSR